MPANQAKPTPGPWRVDGRYVKSGRRKTLPICEVPQAWIQQSRVDQANADFIVRACNSHQALLEALEGLYSVVNLIGWSPIRDLDERMEAARLALQKGQP